MARKPTALTVVPPDQDLVDGKGVVQDRVYSAYLTELNPRGNDEVQMALASSPDPRFKNFLECINRAKYRKVSLATIAKTCNISPAEFANWWQKQSSQRAVAKAQLGSVAVTEDMVKDARSQDVFCARCDGLGFVAAPPGLEEYEVPGYKCVVASTALDPAKFIRDCPNCKGVKVVRKPGDPHARDKILDMAGLVKKNAGVSIVQNFGGASQSSALGDVSGAIDITGEEI